MAKLTTEELDALRSAMLQRESSGNYKAQNQLGYVGGYQFGAAALETLGYLKKGSSKQGNKAINDPANWTGKSGLKSVDDFFDNPVIQDQIFDENVRFNQRELQRKGTINTDTSSGDLAGFLAASHLLGAGGASSDLTRIDANNVSGQSYFDLGRNAVSLSAPAPSSTQATQPSMNGASMAPGSWGLVGMFADWYRNNEKNKQLDAMGEAMYPPVPELPTRYSFEEQQAMSDAMSGVGNDQVASVNYNAPPPPPPEPQYNTMEELLQDKGLINPLMNWHWAGR